MMTRRYSLTARRLVLVVAAALIASLAVAASGAQAVVVQDGGGDTLGVTLAPATPVQSFSGTGYTAVPHTSAPCHDPGLAADFGPSLPDDALCLQDLSPAAGATVLPKAELFAFTWDADRLYPTQTRGYVEQFLRDTADAGSVGAMSNPFASTSQYTDVLGNRAATPKLYGGGCIDLGNPGGYTCQFGNTNGSGTGNPYPVTPSPNACTPSGGDDACLTDAAIQHEVSTMLASTGVDTLKARTGNTPLIVMMLPKFVEVCTDSSGKLCSVNSSSATSTFCTYHSSVGGVPYVVLPWTTDTSCDPANMPVLPNNPTPPQIEIDAGSRLVGSLSGAISAALVNPFLNGWFGNDGSEIDDICGTGNHDVDTDPLGNGAYVLQRAFNNAATLQYDAYTYFGCAPTVNLIPTFVVPSAVNAGDTVQFDGSATPSTLLVSKGNYHWDFGDGSTATGPSVTHSFGKGGNYAVKLTVTDRGTNSASIVETVQVLGADGSTPPPGGSNPGSGPGNGGAGGLNVHLQLLPQSLKNVLKSGIAVRVTSNRAANGIATVWITRASAKRAGIKVGKGPAVRIGIGTLSSIKNGTVTLHLHFSRATAKKLAHLKHVAMTVRLALVAAGNQQSAIDAAGRY
jgi:hypothetical protein